MSGKLRCNKLLQTLVNIRHFLIQRCNYNINGANKITRMTFN